MKIYIYYQFRDGPWGGGNQFLKALKSFWAKTNVYTHSLEEADVVLINSYSYGQERSVLFALRLKRKYPQKVIVYRVDGPISSIRGRDRWVDKIITIFAGLFCDGIIYQSQWSMQENKKNFGTVAPFETAIYNAVDESIFNRFGKTNFSSNRKVRLIASSWSSNFRKGFEIYKYLDKHLDFEKYEFIFVGNSPVIFENIKHTKPVGSQILAQELKISDIYITASKNDPCSNSLIEALACGLPVVALNSGGHPELIGKGGELFYGTEDVLESIYKVAGNYRLYQTQIPRVSIEETGGKYCFFSEQVIMAVNQGVYRPKVVTTSAYFKIGLIFIFVLFLKIKNGCTFLFNILTR